MSASADDPKATEARLADLDRLITRSGLCHAMQDLLHDYILLEDYFMSQNIKIALDAGRSGAAAGAAAAGVLLEDESGGDFGGGVGGGQGGADEPQFASLMLDDVFFLLKKCVQRAISGQNVDGVCAVVNNACTVLEQDFCGMLQGQLKLGFPTGYLDLTYNMLHSSYQQGKLQGGDMDKQKHIFLVRKCSSQNVFVLTPFSYLARFEQHRERHRLHQPPDRRPPEGHHGHRQQQEREGEGEAGELPRGTAWGLGKTEIGSRSG